MRSHQRSRRSKDSRKENDKQVLYAQFGEHVTRSCNGIPIVQSNISPFPLLQVCIPKMTTSIYFFQLNTLILLGLYSRVRSMTQDMSIFSFKTCHPSKLSSCEIKHLGSNRVRQPSRVNVTVPTQRARSRPQDITTLNACKKESMQS